MGRVKNLGFYLDLRVKIVYCDDSWMHWGMTIINLLKNCGGKMNLIKKLNSIIVIIAFNCSLCFAQDISVNEIINNVHKTYREAQTYIDKGEVKTTVIMKGSQHFDTKPFNTVFVRPDQFRYEFQYKPNPDESYWDKYIVWQHGNEILKQKSTKNKIETLQLLSMAIASATGISGGSAHYIPSLLLPYEVGGIKITNLKNIEIVESKEGVIQIEGSLQDEVSVNLWIDSESFLIKKIDIHTKSDDFESTTSITYNPKVNVSIDDEKLKFERDN